MNVGVLDVDGWVGAAYQPSGGVYLQGDDGTRREAWMKPGEIYRLARDEQGWAVTSEAWPPGAGPLRLCRDGVLVDTLPFVGGHAAALNPSLTYDIVGGLDRPGLWALWENMF